MKVIVTGATGFVGRAVLWECLKDDRVSEVVVINRKPTGESHQKLKEIIHADFFDLESVKAQLSGFDAAFFCLGVSSFRMGEEQYAKLTNTLTLHFAETVKAVNENITFCYVSGQGTDSTERGSSMWARVKGKTENQLLGMGFAKAFMFRPGYIHPIGKLKSSTPIYNTFIPIFKFLYPVLRLFFSSSMTTSENIGKAMLNCADTGSSKRVLENVDINQTAKN